MLDSFAHKPNKGDRRDGVERTSISFSQRKSKTRTRAIVQQSGNCKGSWIGFEVRMRGIVFASFFRIPTLLSNAFERCSSQNLPGWSARDLRFTHAAGYPHTRPRSLEYVMSSISGHFSNSESFPSKIEKRLFLLDFHAFGALSGTN